MSGYAKPRSDGLGRVRISAVGYGLGFFCLGGGMCKVCEEKKKVARNMSILERR